MQDHIAELRSLANQARDYQLTRGWSDTQICREIAHLGSTKTYKRILDLEDDLDELNIANQLKNYTAAVEEIQRLRGKDRLAEPIYKDFANIRDCRAAVNRALDEDSIARLVVIEGESGTGKDAVKDSLLDIRPKATVALDANTFWEYSLAIPTKEIYEAMDIRRRSEGGGGEPMPRYPHAVARVIVEELKKRKMLLIINEGHHCGRQFLDVMKMIINETPSVLVLLAIPSLLAKLERTEFATVNQLFSNRLIERVRLPSPTAEDIALMAERRGVRWAGGAENEALKSLVAQAPSHGHWRFVGLVVRELVKASRRAPVTLEEFNKLRDGVMSRRIARQGVGRVS